jgi:hypothetical protein
MAATPALAPPRRRVQGCMVGIVVGISEHRRPRALADGLP